MKDHRTLKKTFIFNVGHLKVDTKEQDFPPQTLCPYYYYFCIIILHHVLLFWFFFPTENCIYLFVFGLDV